MERCSITNLLRLVKIGTAINAQIEIKLTAPLQYINKVRVIADVTLDKVIIYDNLIVMKWKVTFFNDKVYNSTLKLPNGIKVRFLKTLEMMQEFGPDLGMPHTRSMGKGLFEVKAKAKEGIGRVFYCTLIKKEIMILHAFVKKTQKTPQKELDTAYSRLEEIKK